MGVLRRSREKHVSQLTNAQKAKLALRLLISVVFVLWRHGTGLDEVLPRPQER